MLTKAWSFPAEAIFEPTFEVSDSRLAHTTDDFHLVMYASQPHKLSNGVISVQDNVKSQANSVNGIAR